MIICIHKARLGKIYINLFNVENNVDKVDESQSLLC